MSIIEIIVMGLLLWLFCGFLDAIFLNTKAINIRKKKRWTAAYRRGYSWAAAELLRGGMTVEEVEDRIYDQTDAFDEGVRAALHDWCAR